MFGGHLEATITLYDKQKFKVVIHRVCKGHRFFNSATLHATREKAEEYAQRKKAIIV
jgi:hypothetical protein